MPWPQNVRNVLHVVEFALHNGPGGDGRASSIFVLGDSEGTLVTMQTLITLYDPVLLAQAGYGASLGDPNEWMGGVILQSPVVDVSCQTPSFAYNCFNATADTGDPDTGNCTATPTMRDRIADCRWSYLPYFFGLGGAAAATNLAEANAAWEARKDFFELEAVAPLRTSCAQLVGSNSHPKAHRPVDSASTYQQPLRLLKDTERSSCLLMGRTCSNLILNRLPALASLPPMLLLAGTRDYFFSDAPALGTRLCEAGVDVEVCKSVGGLAVACC